MTSDEIIALAKEANRIRRTLDQSGLTDPTKASSVESLPYDRNQLRFLLPAIRTALRPSQPALDEEAVKPDTFIQLIDPDNGRS